MNKIVFLAVMTLSTVSFAGPGGGAHSHSHDKHKISKEKSIELGRKEVGVLIKAGKIDASWKDATFDKSEKKKIKSRTEWVVTFNNKKGVKGKKLFIFFKLSGKIIAANFSGK